jgi:hypothetical protein
MKPRTLLLLAVLVGLLLVCPYSVGRWFPTF